MLFFFYNLILNILSPLIIFYYILRVFITKKETAGFKQRLGLFDKKTVEILKENRNNWIWVHAVSVGEVVAAASMITEIRNLSLPYKILLSTVTDTGQEMARKKNLDIDFLIYFPLDLSFIVQKVLKLVRPKIIILVETELWPNFLYFAKKQNAKILLLNGRISDKSYVGYSKFKNIIKPVLDNLDILGMQSEQDAQKIINIGADPYKVRVIGNTKFDINYLVISEDKKENLKREFSSNPDALFFIAGSTHKGEEEIIISSFQKIFKKFNNLKLIIAPRHPERVKEVEDIIKQTPFSYVRKTMCSQYDEYNIVLIDTIGELFLLYSISDVVFIGGSLVPVGGHNVLEAISFGKVVLHGPYINNFSEMIKLLKSTESVILVNNEQELSEKAIELLLNKEKRDRIGKLAIEVIERNKGSSKTCALLVKDLLSS